MRQLEHHEVKTQQHNKHIVVIVEDVTSPENVGMVFRISEAMGVSKIYLTGNTPILPNKKITKTARTTEKRLPSEHFAETKNVIQQLSNDGYTLFALEVTDKSKQLSEANFNTSEKIALFIGSETSGIRAATLDQMTTAVMIPMFGKNTSINVVTALSIALYEIIRI